MTRFTPRLTTLDSYARALLLTLGVSGTGCSSVVEAEGGGGSSGDGGAGLGGGGAGASTGTGLSSTSSSMTTSSTNSSTGAGGSSHGCENPMPLLVNGTDTGFDTCDGGQLRRRAALDCPLTFPDTNPCCGTCPDGQVCNTQGEIACTCVDACENDADCAAGEVCLCGAAAGICTSAQCQTGADCAPGEECTSWDTTLGCLYFAFACTTASDTCGGDLDCVAPEPPYCAVQPDGHRACTEGGCAIGRPFLVHGRARIAATTPRSDWLSEHALPSSAGLCRHDRERLALEWRRVGQMEHASVAAFARFTLQLLALGAPAELVVASTRAMADETRHARIAFSFASAYGGTPIGPGTLSPRDAMDESGFEDVVRLVIREGCVGETVAAVEAGEASQAAQDPAVSSALATIAEDESRHAELAWRFVRWALDTQGEPVRAVIEQELAHALLPAATAAEPELASEADLLAHGIVHGELRAFVRATTLKRVVVPALSALVAQEPTRHRRDRTGLA